jgi:hypothetical protein
VPVILRSWAVTLAIVDGGVVRSRLLYLTTSDYPVLLSVVPSSGWQACGSGSVTGLDLCDGGVIDDSIAEPLTEIIWCTWYLE